MTVAFAPVASLPLSAIAGVVGVAEDLRRFALQVARGVSFAAECNRRYAAIRHLQGLSDAALAARGLTREEVVTSVYWLEFAD